MRDEPPEEAAHPMKWTEERALLLASDWFRPLPEAIVDRLAAMTVRRRLQDGQLLFARGDAPDGLYCVVRGQVRISSNSSDGKELLLMQFEAGSWFGEISMFDGLGRTHDGRAQGEAEILMLPRDRFLALLAEQPELYPHFLQMLCRKLRLAFAYIEDAQFEPLVIRLARRLLDLIALYGKPADDGGMRIDLHLPQDDLARMLGASRQAISKTLKSWESQGWIALQYGQLVVLKTDPLQAMADSGASAGAVRESPEL